MSIKISVIVPFFKSEKFIDTCLQSIRAQTFSDIEIICVDDCSPDNCVDIVLRHQKEDPRIVLLRHENNLGLGGARNTGIRAARADYIASVDSDDTIRPNMFELLWKAAENGTYDIVSCGFDRVDEEGNFISSQAPEARILRNENNNLNIFSHFNPAFWNKIWRKSLFIENEIWFPNHVFYQDSATTPRLLAKAKRIRIIQDRLYNYLVRPGSATTTFSPKHLTDYFKVYDVLLDFLEKEGLTKRYSDELFDYIDRGVSHHGNNFVVSCKDEEMITQYLRHFLMFKTGFVENYRYLHGKNKEELLELLTKARTKADLIPPDSKEILPISLIIKTFLRPKMLERMLISIGKYEETWAVRFAEIIVGDDSPPDIIGANKRAIHKAKDLYPHLNIHHKTYEEDIGLADGRNRMVESARQDYILLCDDDFILDEESDIRNALGIIQSGQFNIVGGWLKNKYNVKTGEFVRRGMVGFFSETKDEIVIDVNEQEINQEQLHATDYLMNFFVAERSVLREIQWDPELKVEEHQEFFYRLWKSPFRAALSKDLFAKHTADRSDNPPRYNEYRFGKENWEENLFRSVRHMGKKRRTLNCCRSNEFERWVVDVDAKTSRQRNVPLLEPIIGQAVRVRSVTPRFQQYFFGNFDLQSVSNDGKYIVCQKAPATDRLPTNTDLADIVLIDQFRVNESRIIGQTTAWCHQQGAQLQFLPGKPTSVIFNVFNEEQSVFQSRETDFVSGTQKTHPLPVAAISPLGDKAASLNFARIYDYSPGYGYAHITDPFADTHHPEADGLVIFDLNNGESKLLISYAQFRDFLVEIGYAAETEEKLVIHNVSFNTDGSKILILLRGFSSNAPFPTFTLVCNSDGSNLRHVFGFCAQYHWKNKDVFIASGSPDMSRELAKKIQVYEIDTETLDYVIIGEGALINDGHCSYSPDRSLLLYDSYAWAKFPYRRLQLYRLSDGKWIDLAHFYAPGKWHANSDSRCDLNPRWSPNGKTITFDSIHEGFRGIYSVDVEEALVSLDAPMHVFGRDDLMKWYDAKYKPVAGTPNNPVTSVASKQIIADTKHHEAVTVQKIKERDRIEKFLSKQRKLLRDPKSFFRDANYRIFRPLHLIFTDKNKK